MLEGPLATEANKRRFEREVELAAGLNHPSIVAIHDSGLSEGHYYFAMDYVSGQRLDDYAKKEQLRLADRLRLMQRICQAMHYAHQHGVIHRDLKPSNILVDNKGEPHILDFGLAKTLDSRPAESLLVSVSGQVLGTLPYMAPEQATGSYQDVDTSTDVYTLGVILYELLTSRYPYPVTGPMADVLKHIAETEPARPTTIDRTIGGEIETIVLKALAKDKERRYESAGALAADIGRYLAGEAIEARRDSGLYLLRKTLRRFKIPVSIGAMFVLLLVAFAIIMSSLYAQAETERRRADARTAELREQVRIMSVEQGRMLAMTGKLATAEKYIWDAYRRKPDDMRTWWALWELYSLQPCLRTVVGNEPRGSCCAFSPDGRRAVCGGLDGSLQLVEMSSGRQLASVDGDGSRIQSIAFGPDGRLAATGGSDGTIRLWDLILGRCTATVAQGRGSGDGSISSIAFNGDGTILAAGNRAGELKLWEIPSARSLPALQGHTGPINAIAFDQPGQLLASGGQDGTVRLWNISQSRCLFTGREQSLSVDAVAFSPSASVLASAGEDMTIRLWDVAASDCLETLEGHGGRIRSLVFSPDGQTLASGGFDRTVKLWRIDSEQPSQCLATLEGHSGPVTALAFSQDTRTLSSGSRGKTLRLWEVPSRRHSVPLEGRVGPVLALSFNANGTLLTAGGSRGYKVWRFAEDDAWAPLLEDKFSDTDLRTVSVAYGTGGPVLAYAGPTGEIRLRGSDPGMAFSVPQAHTGKATCVTLAPGGQRVASCGDDNVVKAWDVGSSDPLFTFKPPGGPSAARSARNACFSADGRLLAVSAYAEVDVLDARSGSTAVILSGSPGLMGPVAFSRDSRLAAAANMDSTIYVWNVSSGRRLLSLTGHAEPIRAVAFSPDGRMLASAGTDGTIRLWELGTGANLTVLRGHTRAVTSIVFSPDGQSLALGSHDERVIIWDLGYYRRHIDGNREYQMSRNQIAEADTSP
jgi:WD40 repeat protein